MTDTTEWNPRYIWYGLAHGKTPSQMMEADKIRWPGGPMCGFMLWISARKGEFVKAHPEACMFGNISDQEAWDRFLEQRSKEQQAELGDAGNDARPV